MLAISHIVSPESAEVMRVPEFSKDIGCIIFGSSKFPVSHGLFCMALSNSLRLEYHVMLLHRTLHDDSVSFYLSFLIVITCFAYLDPLGRK